MASHNQTLRCSFDSKNVQKHAKSRTARSDYVVAYVRPDGWRLSGSEPSARPRRGVAHVAHAIVHPIGAAAPQLHGVGEQPVAAPLRGSRHQGTGEPSLELLIARA